MNFSLKLAHARVLAALEDLSSFQRVATIRELLREADALDRSLRASLRATVDELRRAGVTWAELAEKTEIPAATIARLSKPARRETDEASPG